MPPAQFSPVLETGLPVVQRAIGTEIVALTNGNFVVTWTELDVRAAVRSYRVDERWALCDAAGNILRQGIITGFDAEVAATADGGFVMSYTDDVARQTSGVPDPTARTAGDVYLQRYDAAGNAAPATLVNSVPDSGDIFAFSPGETRSAVAVLASGEVIVAYFAAPFNAQVGNIVIQRFDAAGAKIGDAVTINTAPATFGEVAITTLAGGNFAVTWTSTANGQDVAGRVFSAAGVALGGEFTVNATTAGAQTLAQIAPLASGGFVAVWQSEGEVFGQLFSATGARVGGEFNLETNSADYQGAPHVTAYPGGGFVVTWADRSTGNFDIVAAVYADDGTPVGSEFRVNVNNSGNEELPGVTALADGSLWFVWNLPGSGPYMTRFVPGVPQDFIGTAGNDTLPGNALDNVINGLGGDDDLRGGDGDDFLIGGAGADVLNGGAGTDIASYEGSVAGVRVSLLTGAGSAGDAQGDVLSGIENLRGSALPDALFGDDRANRLEGGGGHDFLIGGLGGDDMLGGVGIDMVSYEDDYGAVYASLAQRAGFGNAAEGDRYTDVEQLRGSRFNDTLVGDDGANLLDGSNGDDVLIGGLGADALIGGGGIDTASYEDQQGQVFVDLLRGVGASNAAQGDTYLGIENVTGTLFGDYIIGSDGANRLDGGAGDDTLIGALGADVLVGGDGVDTASYEDQQGQVFVDLLRGIGASNAAQGDTFFSIENVTGTLFGDYIIGSDGGNRLDGGAGNDTLIGALGADVLIGGDGIDTASYEDQQGAVTIDLLRGRGFGNAAEGDTYAGIENAAGTLFADTLIGSDGANRLAGGRGADTLFGLGGADDFVFDTQLEPGNVDRIVDFTPGSDRIVLDGDIFGLSPGPLAPNVFIASGQATGGSNRIVYDPATGALFYDSDGFGSDPAIQFATLEGRPPLTSADFIVV